MLAHELIFQRFQVSVFSAAAGQKKTAGQIEKETNSSPQNAKKENFK